ncbi:MAG: hypothetical protein ACJAS3_002663 [Roseivirga sp.]|jgi:hypothetical protein
MIASRDKASTDDFLRKLPMNPKASETQAFWTYTRG